MKPCRRRGRRPGQRCRPGDASIRRTARVLGMPAGPHRACPLGKTSRPRTTKSATWASEGEPFVERDELPPVARTACCRLRGRRGRPRGSRCRRSRPRRRTTSAAAASDATGANAPIDVGMRAKTQRRDARRARRRRRGRARSAGRRAAQVVDPVRVAAARSRRSGRASARSPSGRCRPTRPRACARAGAGCA